MSYTVFNHLNEALDQYAAAVGVADLDPSTKNVRKMVESRNVACQAYERVVSEVGEWPAFCWLVDGRGYRFANTIEAEVYAKRAESDKPHLHVSFPFTRCKKPPFWQGKPSK